jgi:maltose alpha-D-glucosyltransferase/alpha-amylase
MPTADPLWYKDAVIYQLHIRAFLDSNSDGIGDIAGLIAQLDYLRDLGVNAVWLLPFYPSPLRDDGYDIADYETVNPTYGSLREFRHLIREAHARDIRVITELVINHTSDQHPWFQRARHAPRDSQYRNWYVWSDTDQKYLGTRIIFKDTEKSNWTWDPVANAYYWHRFFSHQPDLNFDNPAVLRAIIRIMYHWLEMGVDGLRLDAIPYLCEREGTNNENLPETHKVVKQLRAALDQRFPDRFFLAEANQWPEDTQHYFGNGDECHMAFHFPLMPRMYMAVAREDRHPITDIMRQTPDIPENCQWAIFLRNHDELTLEMVTDRERDYLWSTFASDARARINLGIRRRLAPLMDNDRRKIELMNSLLMSMPGTPILYYGDEIGMGDNLYLGDRNGVRTPMQWSPDRNGGFSRADPASLFLPPLMDPIYGYQAVNVESQTRNSASLLNWMKRLIAVRKGRRVFGRGAITFLYPTNRQILAYVRSHEEERVLCIANLSRSAQAVSLDLTAYRGLVPRELLGKSQFPQIGDTYYTLTLPPYAFYWFELMTPSALAEPVEFAEPIAPDLVTLVMTDGLQSLVDGRNRNFIERDILPPFLSVQRWFAAKDAKNTVTRLKSVVQLGEPGSPIFLAFVENEAASHIDSYFLPVALLWQSVADTPRNLLPRLIAKTRFGAREGVLLDAAALPSFGPDLIRAMQSGDRLELSGGELRFSVTEPGKAIDLEGVEGRVIGGEQSNTSMLIGDRAVTKIYRRIEPGIQPEIEMGRFLTEAGFANSPPLVGALELVRPGVAPTALAVAHRFVANQGDAWSFTLTYLHRAIDELIVLSDEEVDARSDIYKEYRPLADALGRRVGEMHAALASRPDLPDFAPEPITEADLEHWSHAAVEDGLKVIARLRGQLDSLPADVAPLAAELIAHEADIRSSLSIDWPDVSRCGLKIRVHGDLHLGQILVAKNDVYIVDFEGEPNRPIAQRRYKTTPLADLSALLRSFDYAAWTTILQMTPGHEPRRDRLERLALAWRDEMNASLVEAYRSVTALAPIAAADDVRERVMRILNATRVFYEIEYEIANRPSWAVIPLTGARDLLFPPPVPAQALPGTGGDHAV